MPEPSRPYEAAKGTPMRIVGTIAQHPTVEWVNIGLLHGNKAHRDPQTRPPTAHFSHPADSGKLPGMIVLIDNYDSFTYNLVQRIGEIDRRQVMKVYRNDQVTLEQIERDHPDHIIISPGPCTPKEAGISVDVIKHFAGRCPSSASASATNPWPTPSAARSSARIGSCTVRPARSSTTARPSSPG